MDYIKLDKTMKTDFSISVQVNIGVTPEVVQLVTAILQRTLPAAAVAAPAASEQPTPETLAPTAGKKGKGKAKPEMPAPDTNAEAETEAVPEINTKNATDTTETTAEAQVADNKELTEQDIREAMHRARQRIEGEDYKNNTDSDGYKKYHKPLTSMFKNIAGLLGSDKPSTLPADKRASFIQQCEELIVKDGEITTNCPY